MNPLLRGMEGADDIKSEFIFSGICEKYCAAMGLTRGVDYYYCALTEVLFHNFPLSEESYRRLYEDVQRSDEVGYSSNEVPKAHLSQKIRDADFKLNLMRSLCVDRMLPGRKILEIGPGEGTLLNKLRGFGYEVGGIEPLNLYADYARDVFKLDVEAGFFFDKIENFSKVDCILFDNVLEHLLNPLDALKLARRTLNDDGIIYVAVPSAEFPNVPAANVAHLTLWTRRALAFVMECAGFSVLCALRGRPKEWVCIAQATHPPKNILTSKPTLFQKVDPVALATSWETAIGRYAQHKGKVARRR